MATAHVIYWDGKDIREAVLEGFKFMESLDHIVGIIYACPPTMKELVLALSEEVFFDYIPEGVGRLRTAYLKFRPLPFEGEIRMVSHDDSTVVRILHQ